MSKNLHSDPEQSKVPILFAACFVFLFISACILAYKNNQFVEKPKGRVLTNSLVSSDIGRSALHDGFFFRQVAQRLVYYPHNPSLVMDSYKLSVMKGPAEYRNLVGYAEYLASRSCCTDVAAHLMKEAARRAPSESDVQRVVGAYLFLKGHKHESISYIHRSIELDPSSAYGLYQHLMDHKIPMAELIHITPLRSEALIELAKFLTSKREKAKAELRTVVDTLLKMPIPPEQRVALARQAFHAGDSQMAKREALIALRSSDSPAEALQLLFDIYWSEKDYVLFEKSARQLEQVHRNSGNIDAAARVAVVVAEWLSKTDERAKTAERLARIAKTYPAYAPVYSLLANFYRGESDELVLYYLKKAVELEPGNSYYSEELAKQHIRLKN